MSKKLSIKLNKRYFPDFIAKVQDLSNINDVVKIKIEREKVLLYATKSNEHTTLALKSYALPTSNYFDDFDEDACFDFIIINSPKFIKSLKFFDIDIQVKMDIIYKPHHEKDDIMLVRSAQFNNGKLKISAIGGEESNVIDLNVNTIEDKTDIDCSNWKFQVAKQDFLDIKRLCSIDSDSKILSFLVEKGNITAEEPSKWELQLGKLEENLNAKIVFNKKYLSNINSDMDMIDFYMFDTFILVKDNISNLMLSFEQDFSDQD